MHWRLLSLKVSLMRKKKLIAPQVLYQCLLGVSPSLPHFLLGSGSAHSNSVLTFLFVLGKNQTDMHEKDGHCKIWLFVLHLSKCICKVTDVIQIEQKKFGRFIKYELDKKIKWKYLFASLNCSWHVPWVSSCKYYLAVHPEKVIKVSKSNQQCTDFNRPVVDLHFLSPLNDL